MIDSFKTIKKPVEDIIFKELGSKFINYAYPVKNEQEVEFFLNILYEKWPDATHHCYAYTIGIDGKNYRANDDGEPSGSAGLPIYNQILSNELNNILIVSVRYFGGTKLGVPGLVKAYKYAAQIVLEEATIVEKYITSDISLTFSYDLQGIIERNIERVNAEIINKHFTGNCTFIVSVRKSKIDDFILLFKEYYQIKLILL